MDNSADPDQMACQKSSDPELHGFLKKIYYGVAGHGLNNVG